MNISELALKIPLVINWIDGTLAAHTSEMRPVTSLGFDRLPLYFCRSLLADTKVVTTVRVPVPPLGRMGLQEFSDFENMESLGITFKDTYFVAQSHASDESLHFHELIHVIQWAHLGVERFLLAYAAGLAQYGYLQSPLEKMAYNLQGRFEQGAEPFDVESAVRMELERFRF